VLDHLRLIPTLQQLDLSRCMHITAAGVERFCQQLRDCNVFHMEEEEA